jgi:hypothetical protein
MVLLFNYVIHNCGILRTKCIKDFGIFRYSKLHFHQHVDYSFCRAIKLLGLIRTVAFSFPSFMLRICLVRTKLEYTSVAWNNLTNTDSNQLERVQRKFCTSC